MSLISAADQARLRDRFRGDDAVRCGCCSSRRRSAVRRACRRGRSSTNCRCCRRESRSTKSTSCWSASGRWQYGIDRVPAIALIGQDERARERDSHIRFLGTPAGYEFISLVRAILLVGGGASMLSAESRAQARGHRSADEHARVLDADVSALSPGRDAGARDCVGEPARHRVRRGGDRVSGPGAPLPRHWSAEDGHQRSQSRSSEPSPKTPSSSRRSPASMVRHQQTWPSERPMSTRAWTAGAILLAAALASQVVLRSETAVSYRFSFPEPQHHWMWVEASFTELSSAPLELRMSRSSPGRYSLHEFAKNVYDVEAAGPDGRAVSTDASGRLWLDHLGAWPGGHRSLQGLWRLRGRHLPRDRPDARAPEHAGVGDVGSRARRPPVAAGVRPA